MTIPTGVKKVIFPLGILFIFATMWYGLYKPEMEKISKYRQEPIAARQQIDDMVRRLSAYSRPTEEERAEWVNAGNALNRRIPKGKQITELEFMHEIAKLFDCMAEYMLKLHKLFSELCEKYDWGDKLNGTVKEMELLCHNFLKFKEMIGKHNGDRT